MGCRRPISPCTSQALARTDTSLHTLQISFSSQYFRRDLTSSKRHARNSRLREHEPHAHRKVTRYTTERLKASNSRAVQTTCRHATPFPDSNRGRFETHSSAMFSDYFIRCVDETCPTCCTPARAYIHEDCCPTVSYLSSP